MKTILMREWLGVRLLTVLLALIAGVPVGWLGESLVVSALREIHSAVFGEELVANEMPKMLFLLLMGTYGISGLMAHISTRGAEITRQGTAWIDGKPVSLVVGTGRFTPDRPEYFWPTFYGMLAVTFFVVGGFFIGKGSQSHFYVAPLPSIKLSGFVSVLIKIAVTVCFFVMGSFLYQTTRKSAFLQAASDGLIAAPLIAFFAFVFRLSANS